MGSQCVEIPIKQTLFGVSAITFGFIEANTYIVFDHVPIASVSGDCIESWFKIFPCFAANCQKSIVSRKEIEKKLGCVKRELVFSMT